MARAVDVWIAAELVVPGDVVEATVVDLVVGGADWVLLGGADATGALCPGYVREAPPNGQVWGRGWLLPQPGNLLELNLNTNHQTTECPLARSGMGPAVVSAVGTGDGGGGGDGVADGGGGHAAMFVQRLLTNAVVPLACWVWYQLACEAMRGSDWPGLSTPTRSLPVVG